MHSAFLRPDLQGIAFKKRSQSPERTGTANVISLQKVLSHIYGRCVIETAKCHPTLSCKGMIDDRAMSEIRYSGGRGAASWIIKNDFRHRLPYKRMRIPAVDRCRDFPDASSFGSFAGGNGHFDERVAEAVGLIHCSRLLC
jgi:hypothetical protein